MPHLRPVHVLPPPAPGGAGMIRLIRSSSPLPRTRTIIRAGSITVPWTMPTEREQRRRWREYSRPPVICAEGCD
ncbi:MAG: hypothetical protein WC343_08050 [Bacilli bacterium]